MSFTQRQKALDMLREIRERGGSDPGSNLSPAPRVASRPPVELHSTTTSAQKRLQSAVLSVFTKLKNQEVDADTAEQWANRGDAVILVRVETSPEDIHGMHASEGILTIHGGTTSHAAVVARGMGKPCISGAGSIRISTVKGTMLTGGRTLEAGDVITIDGTRGEVLLGALPMVQPELSGDFATLIGWADDIRRMKVRANAETPEEARTARDFGAEGIGLCRTERMFNDEERIRAVRRFILANDIAEREEALNAMQAMQKRV